MRFILHPNVSLISVLILVLITSGCSWFGAGKVRKELEAGSSERVVIPPTLDQPEFVDSMPIPEVIDSRGLADREYTLGLPDALSSSFGVEQIVIKKLGDERWVFVDLPPATVWPKVLQFWESNDLSLEAADPASGILTSQWLSARNGSADDVFDSLKAGNVFANSTGVTSHKFQLKVEPGIRSGSTEIYLEHRAIPEGAPFRLDQVEWKGESDNLELESKVLSAIAYYLGETVSQGSISLMATGLQESRAELVPDKEKPVLKYKLAFNRAWATVGAALENARVPVEDLDRSSANYYVYYSADHQPEPGFFKNLFSKDDELEAGPVNRYTVHLTTAGDEVHVTVFKAEAILADTLIAERLLRVIKEYST
jgi:outer membrane protein assembly factor BamC